MTAKIINGRQIADEYLRRIKQNVAKLSTPAIFAAILVGDDPASKSYVSAKKLACNKAGIVPKIIELPKTIDEPKLLHIINDLNQDKNISGILIQLPLPKQINTQTIIEAIDPNKDIDGFHPINIGLLAQKHPRFRPCTPYGIMELLKHTGIHLAGKDVIVIGASLIVGLPMTLELLMKDCTVTTCHAETKNLSNKIKQADIVIAAIGQPNYIKGKWIKENAIVIDVGINRLPDGTLTGDVDFESAKEKASWITPVPGGVGPMTVAMLLQNALLAAALHLT
ncbi:MAG: bifunctional methylenetetrahydrofolate dehydrogenase/methenyltetrahydrofolate cyclohydrolase [Gammaproteobacteria bacterium RIFCSPHIGHO2_02_FULL_42_13]|nr:MAG: bifunctional methylenetetrahydrofolate dehydrogenase/methenyltetrahydrofolate cyclohydrolase [Gammaproteobacteria bacterium RIFCSPHIGHO2_02_FULL_42_13]OGT69419.1 MAG: bifunctional methylenetetrahydrofolate dehydrogenase/methenyltetrahydrofolate cyclohydrolase [Gammaproteobacteria bacterium RIFCSPLOWO2_02_FULL_42_9]